MENQKKEVWLRKALFLIVSLALFFPMMAQTITVKGVVKESMTGEPIIGANVAVKGTTNGTISDISGMYQISNVSSNAVLIVSYIGYKAREERRREHKLQPRRPSQNRPKCIAPSPQTSPPRERTSTNLWR